MVGLLLMNWIESMSHLDTSRAATCPEQVYLIDRDAGLLCRILGLYAARAMDVLHVDYANADQEVMRLRVRIGRDAVGTCDTAESIRVLVENVSTYVGVLAAAEHSEDVAHRREESGT